MKTFLKVLLGIRIGIAALEVIWLICIVGIAIWSLSTSDDGPYQITSEYDDYIALPVNIAYVETEQELFQYSKITNIDKVEYFKIKGLDTEEMVGTKYTKETLISSIENQLVLVNNKDFDIWNDWNVNEVELIISHQLAGSSSDQEVLDAFVSIVSLAEDNLAEGLREDVDAEHNGVTSVSVQRATLKAGFSESSSIEWSADIYIYGYANGEYRVTVMMEYFDEYPEITIGKFDLDTDSPLHEFIVSSSISDEN
jgi:hypothetical protein